MNKIFVIFMIAVMALSYNAFAADEPPYDVTGCDDSIESPLGNKPPSDANIILLPDQNGTFSYTFASYKTQYSDFVIVPMTSAASINIGIVGDEEHDVTVKLMQDSTEIFSVEVTVDSSMTEINIPFYELEPNTAYYIKLKSSSINGANGKIIVTGTTGSDKEVILTRANFAIKLAELLNFDTAIEDEAPFDDVGIYDYPYKAVMMLKKAGVVKGTGNNLFAPNDKITYAQAFYMAARLFVDDETIEAAAPYPLGGAVICSQMGLTSEINASIDDPVTQVGCMHLFNNIRNICKSDEYDLCQ